MPCRAPPVSVLAMCMYTRILQWEAKMSNFKLLQTAPSKLDIAAEKTPFARWTMIFSNTSEKIQTSELTRLGK